MESLPLRNESDRFKLVIRASDRSDYLWDVLNNNRAHAEGISYLNPSQYDHIVAQVREIAREQEPSNCSTVDIRPFSEFFELRDKGGILGKINIRVYFAIIKEKRAIAILSVDKKENENQAPPHILRRCRTRFRSLSI
jgi:hypothetical protein